MARATVRARARSMAITRWRTTARSMPTARAAIEGNGIDYGRVTTRVQFFFFMVKMIHSICELGLNDWFSLFQNEKLIIIEGFRILKTFDNYEDEMKARGFRFP